MDKKRELPVSLTTPVPKKSKAEAFDDLFGEDDDSPF